MDLIDIIVEKRFVGQEFLTWLWRKSETEGGEIKVHYDNPDDVIEVVFEQRILLDDTNDGKVVCSGPSELPEAIWGLSVGKKVEQAKIRLTVNDLEYSLTLSGSLLEFKGVKLPKTAGTESAEDMAGLMYERVGMFNSLRDAVHSLFKKFLLIRVDPVKWGNELIDLRAWINTYRQ
jgi:recombination associated protein RdgC